MPFRLVSFRALWLCVAVFSIFDATEFGLKKSGVHCVCVEKCELLFTHLHWFWTADEMLLLHSANSLIIMMTILIISILAVLLIYEIV